MADSLVEEGLRTDDTRQDDPAPQSAPESDDNESRVHYDQPWLTSVLRPFLISILAACMTIALLAFLRHAIPGMPALYAGTMIVLGVGGALVGCVSTTWLAQPKQRMRRNSGIRAAEFGLLLGLTRIATWLTSGYFPPLSLLLTRPVDALLDMPFIISMFVVLLSWFMASAMTSDFLKMGLQSDELYAAQQRTGRSTDDPAPPNYTDRRGVLGAFVTRWLVGGVLLVLLAAGTQVGPSANGFFALARQQIDPAVIIAVVIYFLVGLVLISQGQLAVLRARWTLEKIPSTPAVLRQWPIYTLGFIAAVGAIAMLLPFGDTFYLARILSAAIHYFYIALVTIFQLVMGLFLVLAALLSGEPEETPPPTPPPVEQAPIQPPPPPTEGLPEWIGGSIFWVFIALLLIYAAYIYLSGRGVQFGWLRQFWLMLRMRWQELFGAYQDWQVARARSRKEKEEEEAGRSLRDRLGAWLRLGNLNPDQQVRYFYLTTLRRAEKAGIPRHASETPAQYAPRLMQRIGEEKARAAAAAQEESHADAASTDATAAEPTLEEQLGGPQAVQELTEAFERVRYAGHHPDDQEIPYLKQLWESLKRRLRGRRGAADADDAENDSEDQSE